jgi:hypothetical protein
MLRLGAATLFTTGASTILGALAGQWRRRRRDRDGPTIMRCRTLRRL